jgi:hypothetical protein
MKQECQSHRAVQSLAILTEQRFQVLMAANTKMVVFWDVASCSLVETDQYFKGTYCHHHQGDHLITSEMSVNFYQTTWCNISEDSHLVTEQRMLS